MSPNQTFRTNAKTAFSLTLFAALAVLLAAADCMAASKDVFENGYKRPAVAAHDDNSLVLSSDGAVYAAGRSTFKLGLGGASVSDAKRGTFLKIPSLSGKNIAAVSAGLNHLLALDGKGKVYAAGRNAYGQLGFGGTGDRNTFAEVSALNGKRIAAIAAGRDHSLAIGDDGKVYAAGYNKYGQLGLGDATNRDIFTEIASLRGKKIVAIAAGDFHSFALDEGGRVYGTGRNWHGTLGLGDGKSRDKFEVIASLSGKKIVAVAAGDFHSFALDTDGKVYATGMNNRGELGLGDKNDRNIFTEVTSLSGKKNVAIAAGRAHSFAIADNGKVYVAGDGYRTGLGAKNRCEKFVEKFMAGQVDHVSESDMYDCWGFIEVPSLSGKKIVAVAAGGYHSLAIDSNGVIYAAGENKEWQLGLGDTNERAEFTPVPL
ncbi:MAG: hypothetical protein LBP89_10510, partial [Helicobacteraceae bacterium]|nr:hypothetical protein [Helicobacteraceae bacterium]